MGGLGADEATSPNVLLVYHKEVELFRDVSETDKYSRLLRYVIVDGILENYELVIQGAARPAVGGRMPPADHIGRS